LPEFLNLFNIPKTIDEFSLTLGKIIH